VPYIAKAEDACKLLQDSLIAKDLSNLSDLSELLVEKLGVVGCKTALRLVERAVVSCRAGDIGEDKTSDDKSRQLRNALQEILNDYVGDQGLKSETCAIVIR
jgi:hypothetical protein